MKPSYLAAALAAAVTMTGPAHAAFTANLTDGAPTSFDVDFRGGNSGGTNLGSTEMFDYIEVTATDGDLNQFPDDGLGITGGEGDEIDDRVDGNESMSLLFTKPLTRPTVLIGISDLFGPDDGGDDGEDGEVQVGVNTSDDGTQSFVADADPLSNVNGEWTLALAGFSVGDELKITLTAGPNGSNNDFSVMGVSQVPLPAAAWLMIGGLGAVGAYARRTRKVAPTA